MIELWLQSQGSDQTKGCYRRDSAPIGPCRQAFEVHRPRDRHSFAQSLIDDGLSPFSRARSIAATKSLFGFCQRMQWIHVNPAAELPLPRYEGRVAERILAEADVQRILV